MKVGIAGAGLLGRLFAWKLLRLGHEVTLFDKDNIVGEQSAGRVAAAMLAPYSELSACDIDIFNWGLQAVDIWPEWIQELAQDTGETVSFQQQGSLVLAHAQDQANLKHFLQLLLAKLRGHQLELSGVKTLDQQQLLSYEPELNHFSGAVYLPAEGCLDNWALLDTLALAISNMKGSVHYETIITDVKPHSIVTNEQTYNFDWVLDCRGFGAKQDLQNFRGVRGEVLWVEAPEVNLTRPVRLMHPRYQLYIAPKPNNRYVIGATEIESESLAPITVRSSLELQSALYSIHKGFAEATVLKAYANCRPAFSNNLPRIEISEGLIRVNGLYRHGYLLSPYVVNTALAALLNQAYNEKIIYTSI